MNKKHQILNNNSLSINDNIEGEFVQTNSYMPVLRSPDKSGRRVKSTQR